MHFRVPNFQKDILQKKSMQIVHFPKFLCRVNSNSAIFTSFGRIMTISGQIHVLFDVHFSDFPEMCIPGDLHILAQNSCIPGDRTVIKI